MVQKVVIRDNTKAPIKYLRDLDNFKNGTEYHFTEGINIIVGANGCGKSTLMNLIKKHLLIYNMESTWGGLKFSNDFCPFIEDMSLGIDVYADYTKKSFAMNDREVSGRTQNSLEDFNSFGAYCTALNASYGESTLVYLNTLLEVMFGKDKNLKFPEVKNNEYKEYIKKHQVNSNRITVLLDEPDRNLDVINMKEIYGVLSYERPDTQLIAIVHNPILIYKLMQKDYINFIEMSENYLYKVKRFCRV